MREWDPDQALADLVDESALDDGDHHAAAERIFREHATVAAKAICHMAVHCSNDRLRLDAAKYVVDRNLGRIGDTDPLRAAGNDPFMQFLKAVTQEATAES
jgi:hypothetical protein